MSDDVSRRAMLTAAGATSNGGVSVDGVRGHLMVDVTNGATDATDIRGNLTVDGTNGRVTAEGVAGDLTVDVTNGDVDAGDVAGDVDVETTNGEVRLRVRPDLDATVEVQTSNGDVVTTGVSGLGDGGGFVATSATGPVRSPSRRRTVTSGSEGRSSHRPKSDSPLLFAVHPPNAEGDEPQHPHTEDRQPGAVLDDGPGHQDVGDDQQREDGADGGGVPPARSGECRLHATSRSRTRPGSSPGQDSRTPVRCGPGR